jgi:hypothetical protein
MMDKAASQAWWHAVAAPFERGVRPHLAAAVTLALRLNLCLGGLDPSLNRIDRVEGAAVEAELCLWCRLVERVHQGLKEVEIFRDCADSSANEHAITWLLREKRFE